MADKLIPLTLEQHQQVLYDIVYMVDDFCKAHDIPYFLVGGSLLGAVRHQGIIPWDDDMDIAMTRENYERFLELFHAEGVEGYELLDYKHTRGFWFPFAKLAKTDTWTSLWETHKIHIDVFPYDGCGDDLEQAQEYFVQNKKKIHQMYCLGSPFSKIYTTWKPRVYFFLVTLPRHFFLYVPLMLFPRLKDKYLLRWHKRHTFYDINHSKYCTNIVWGCYGKGEVQLSEGFLKLDKMRFGTRELPVPSGWHEYLTGIYGDYMQLPPEDKRRTHLEDGSYRIAPSPLPSP